MVRKVWTLALVMGLSMSALTAENLCFEEGGNCADTVDLLADAVVGGLADEPLKNMNDLADDAEKALEEKLDDLEVHIKNEMLDRLKHSLEFLMLDTEAAAEMAEEAAKLGGVESRVLLDLIKKNADQREAYIEEMINELGQARAMLEEIVALRKAIMGTMERDREDAIEMYQEA
ncbi:MAG: hypothetical protein PVJ92_02875 [Candidatus Dependentiae bacterium]|jgi:hypothetical protein